MVAERESEKSKVRDYVKKMHDAFGKHCKEEMPPEVVAIGNVSCEVLTLICSRAEELGVPSADFVQKVLRAANLRVELAITSCWMEEMGIPPEMFGDVLGRLASSMDKE